jgi:tyrosyl-tRNA synthetase
MDSKKALARELVTRFHGSAAALQAEEEFTQQFRQKEISEDIPVVRMAAGGVFWICRLLVDAGLVGSNGEARRLVQQGGVKVNGEKIDNADLEVAAAGEVILQAGKRRFARVLFAG